MSLFKQYKSYLSDYLQTYHGINNPKKFFRCLNPEHDDNNPSMIYIDKYDICKCFSCGVSYDIFSLVGIDYHLDNFKDQIDKVKELYLGYIPKVKKQAEVIADNFYDYSKYFYYCISNIDKTNYLSQRGISKELIKKYKIGFDVNRNMIVFPINKYCYFARSVINDVKFKSKGKSDIWNKKHLLDSNKDSLVYVTESIIDSLSLEEIDPNIATISINGIGNINSFIHCLNEVGYQGTIIIVFDNDFRGNQATKLLEKELANINVNSFSATMIKNFDGCKDINEALICDREKLKRNYEYFNNTFCQVISLKEKGDDINY